jgi:uncharacterized protein YciI
VSAPLHFIVLGTDAPGMQALRIELRPRHRAWLREHPGHALTVVHGGPTLDEEGAMNGTLLVVEAPGKADVERFVAEDPYVRGGVFARVEIRAWNWTLRSPASS